MLIPEAVAGRDDVFFFGTLIHLEVLAAVLDRPVAEHETSEATLHGFRRERAAAASYPVLVAAPGDRVTGRLLHRPSRRDIRRINHFEDDEYSARRLIVEAASGARAAWAFMGLAEVATMRPSGEPWHPGSWAEQHLAGYREAIRHWMRGAPE